MRKGGLYLALGDSTTWTIPVGLPGDDGSKLVSYRLWQWINQNYAPVKYVNKGIGGALSSDMIKPQYIHWALRLNPDLVTIQIGMNDCVNDQTGVTNFQNNLTTIINTLKQRNPNVQIILCAPNQTTDSTRTPYVQNYRNAMQTIATNMNVGFCDFSTAWTNAQCSTYCEQNAGPYIHPNGNGHQLLYNLLQPIVQTQCASWLSSLG